MSNEATIAVAKAVEAWAEPASKAIGLTEKTLRVFHRIFGRSAEICGETVAGWLEVKQWEIFNKLADRVEAKLSERQAMGRLRSVPLSFSVPLLQAATLEEDDTLQDLWAELMASALDSECPPVRKAFVEIVSDLEVIDAKLLRYLYDQYRFSPRPSADEADAKEYGNAKAESVDEPIESSPLRFPIDADIIQSEFDLSREAYQVAVDNLVRFRCAAPYLANRNFYMAQNGALALSRMAVDYGYQKIAPTTLGISLVEACISSDLNKPPTSKA